MTIEPGEQVAGILPDRMIKKLFTSGEISAATEPVEGQIQPASLDLRLGKSAFRIRASFLPGPDLSVADKLARYQLHEIDLSQGAVLETGCVYLVPLQEQLNLPAGLSASANPKSSTGRLDIFTRVIVDRAREFDQIPAGYSGPLYLEISPRTFPIVVRPGSRLSQIRFRSGHPQLSDSELVALHEETPLVIGSEPHIAGGLAFSIDLEGTGEGAPIGYRGKPHSAVVDVDKPDAYEVLDFWEPIFPRGAAELILDPDQFYILVSREAVQVPPDYAAEMVPFDPLVGEFRVHYAGFFDPGFGHTKDDAGNLLGSRAVLEVRSHEVPFILEHGQTIGRLVYEPMLSRPEALYGVDMKSNYQGQGLKLSKHFRS
uniref:2'-deoxycytidine 5'-triphosphate deaminase n=1 Tax=Pararhizobium sp. IMCC3301 TaxID=3067904 RepID=UPI0035327502